MARSGRSSDAGDRAGGSAITQLSGWSAGAPWADALTIEKFRVGPGEVTEHSLGLHAIGLRLGAPGMVGMRLDGGAMRTSLAQPGDMCLISAGVRFAGRHEIASEFLFLGLGPAFVAAIAGRAEYGLQDPAFSNPCSVADPVVRHIASALAEEAAAGCPTGRLYGESLGAALAAHLLRRYAAGPATMPGHRGGLSPPRLRRVLDYVAASPESRIGLHELAALAELSPQHFSAAFKRSTGMAPYRYVLAQRIERARILLADGRLSIAEVGAMLGFASQAHFTTVFRRLTGMTPGAFRARR